MFTGLIFSGHSLPYIHSTDAKHASCSYNKGNIVLVHLLNTKDGMEMERYGNSAHNTAKENSSTFSLTKSY